MHEMGCGILAGSAFALDDDRVSRHGKALQQRPRGLNGGRLTGQGVGQGVGCSRGCQPALQVGHAPQVAKDGIQPRRVQRAGVEVGAVQRNHRFGFVNTPVLRVQYADPQGRAEYFDPFLQEWRAAVGQLAQIQNADPGGRQTAKVGRGGSQKLKRSRFQWGRKLSGSVRSDGPGDSQSSGRIVFMDPLPLTR